jgi:hypothetical protein
MKDSKAKTSALVVRQKAKATATPTARATPSKKGKSNGKTILAAATLSCCQKAVDRAVVVIDGMTRL